MSADEFWKDDPQLFVSYRTSFINKKKREMEEEDYKSWLRGLYIYNGNGLLMSSLKQLLHNIVAGFSKTGKQDNKKIESYPSKPYTELQKESIKEENKKKTVRDEKYKQYENDLVYFGTLKQQYLDRMSKIKK